MSVQNLSFGGGVDDQQSTGSKQSLGFGAVQSMDGRRQKQKPSKQQRMAANTTGSFNNSLKVSKKPSSSKQQQAAQNSSKAAADQINFMAAKQETE